MTSSFEQSSRGLRQQRAAQLRAQAETAKQSPAQADPGNQPAQQETEPQYQGIGPAGQGDYVVKQGDCISSIAKDTGHFWETIWNDPANAELKEVRKNPNVLLAADRVTIPEAKPKEEPAQTEIRHRFRRKGEPSWLRLRLTESGEPRANESYTLIVDGRERTGTTDVCGRLNEPIPGNARSAILHIGDDEYHLKLGSVDPVTELKGVQTRLNNLGFNCGPVDGILGAKTLSALKAFQRQMGLPVSGKVDDATRKALEDEHDGMRGSTSAGAEEPDRDEPDPMAQDFPPGDEEKDAPEESIGE